MIFVKRPQFTHIKSITAQGTSVNDLKVLSPLRGTGTTKLECLL
jgi:hypothetical protein